MLFPGTPQYWTQLDLHGMLTSISVKVVFPPGVQQACGLLSVYRHVACAATVMLGFHADVEYLRLESRSPISSHELRKQRLPARSLVARSRKPQQQQDV